MQENEFVEKTFEQTEKQPERQSDIPSDSSALWIESHLKITDANTGQIIMNTRV